MLCARTLIHPLYLNFQNAQKNCPISQHRGPEMLALHCLYSLILGTGPLYWALWRSRYTPYSIYFRMAMAFGTLYLGIWTLWNLRPGFGLEITCYSSFLTYPTAPSSSIVPTWAFKGYYVMTLGSMYGI